MDEEIFEQIPLNEGEQLMANLLLEAFCDLSKGKPKDLGRLLDGREHNDMPRVILPESPNAA